MDLADEHQRAQWRRYLGQLLTDRPVIAGLLPLGAMGEWVELVHEAGGRRPLLLATGTGAGDPPSADQAEVVMVPTARHESMTAELRDQDRLARELPEDVVAAVQRYDPDGTAVWLFGPFVDNRPLLGRAVLGGRPAAWLALEDKLRAEEVWRALGAPRAESAVEDVDAAALAETSRTLDQGHGTVWAGDARDGFNGGGEFVRWVVSDEDREAALDFFAPRCDRVRVMPFLEGVPCSIHGIVLADGTAAFRPVELAVLRGANRGFVYGGQGTFWDPPEHDRAHMRALVKRTGEHLRDLVGYRGAFGIDGVLTADGFRPTEINTRFSGGLTTLARGVDHTAFTLLQLNLLAGRDPQVGVAELEAWALPAMDGCRTGRALGMSGTRVVDASTDLRVAWDGVALRRCDTGDLTVTAGPSSVGTFARIVLEDGGLPRGERLALLNVALLRFLDEELGTGFGPVEAAPDVRR